MHSSSEAHHAEALSNVQYRDAGLELVYNRQEVRIHCD